MGMGEARTGIVCGPSRTKQAMKDECDINNIMKRYKTTGLITHVKQNPGEYADVSEVSDYRTSLNRIKNAEKNFSRLPATLRARFDNNVADFLDFASNPDNLEEMTKLGIIPKGKEPAAAPAPDPKKEPPPTSGEGSNER